MSSLNNKALNDFLKSIRQELPGKMVYAKVWGSHSHNTGLPTSDIDFMGVYQVPTKTILGLDPYQESKVGKSPDYQFHETGKFCRLLLKGNPEVVETLFTEHWQVMTTAWEELRAIRETFLNQRTVKQYLGYCSGQLQRLLSGNRLVYNTEWAYHLIRLALDSRRIAIGLHPKIWKEGKEREHLMAIRAGEYTHEQIEREFKDIVNSIDISKLPIGPDIEKLNSWLLKQREKDLEVL